MWYAFELGVGFHVGGDSHVNYLGLQIHYAVAKTEPDNSGLALTITTTPPDYQQGILLLVSNYAIIQPNQPGNPANQRIKNLIPLKVLVAPIIITMKDILNLRK